MNDDMVQIAGGPGDQDGPHSVKFKAEQAACIEALDPVVRRLVREGLSANAIVSALAAVTVLTIDRQSQN